MAIASTKGPAGSSGLLSDPPDSNVLPPRGDRTPISVRKALSVGKGAFSAVLSVFQVHPLFIGAVLLFVLSSSAGRASWGFPDLSQSSGLGGEDVEEVLVEDSVDPGEVSDASLIAPAAAFTLPAFVSENDLTQVDSDLVTVPWAPLTPSGSSGHNVVRYTVRDGDTLSSIAAAFNVGVQSVAWSNDLVDPDSIRPGDTLRVPPVDGVLHVVKQGETADALAKRFSVDTQSILSFNGLPADGVLITGNELVIPGGIPPAPPRPKTIARKSAPQFAAGQATLGYYIAPTTGRNYGRRHANNGVDIANSCGTPIYAAAAGTVIRADASGWNGGYGKMIELAHVNGTETLYAHLSQIVADSGSVGQGELIGLIGTTGRSTGCHLHFEVHGARNPLAR